MDAMPYGFMSGGGMGSLMPHMSPHGMQGGMMQGGMMLPGAQHGYMQQQRHPGLHPLDPGMHHPLDPGLHPLQTRHSLDPPHPLDPGLHPPHPQQLHPPHPQQHPHHHPPSDDGPGMQIWMGNM